MPFLQIKNFFMVSVAIKKNHLDHLMQSVKLSQI